MMVANIQARTLKAEVEKVPCEFGPKRGGGGLRNFQPIKRESG